MATTKIQKELTEVVENFIGLWNRYYTQYLEGISPEDITGEKENELLKFQGTMVEQLVLVLEIDEQRRFDIHDKAMSVINEVVSLDLYTKMSEFQISRVKRNWQEAMDELEKFYRFCDTYDPKIDKVQKISEVKKKNPFWDPTSGGMRGALARLVVSPVVFFQGLKLGVKPEGMGTFIFLTFFVPSVIILGIVFLMNFALVKAVGRNSLIESGLLSSGEEGFVPTLMIAGAVFLGLLLIALAVTVVLLILHLVIQFFLHLGFKIAGAKEGYLETQKAVVYGTAPFIAVVTIPYAAVLQVIGSSKLHGYHYFLAAVGWLMGIILFLAVGFGIATAVFYFTGNLPTGEYLYVMEETPLLSSGGHEEMHTAHAGDWFSDFKEDKKTIRISRTDSIEAYRVTYEDKDYYIAASHVDKREFSLAGIPSFIIGKGLAGIGRARGFLDGLIEQYSE